MTKSVLAESRDIQLAAEMIQLGARMQLLEAETGLSRERLLRLYKELKGVSPPKGLLPFSVEWFATWQPNIHSSFFVAIRKYLQTHAGLTGIEATLKAYRLYLEQMGPAPGEEPVLSLTRAWTLVRFLNSELLTSASCKCCGGEFVVDSMEVRRSYTCGLCHVPSRAGKTRQAKQRIEQALATAAKVGGEQALAAALD